MSLLPIEEAFRIIAETTPLLPVEQVPPREALGRVLAEAVAAPIDLPPFENSAVDGYAVRSRDLVALPARASESGPTVTLRVRGAVAAGGAAIGALASGETARVMTGGRIPAGADAVVMREDVAEAPDVARVRRAVEPGANVRPRGEEIRGGEVALEAGRRVNPGGLGFLLALGVERVAVRRRPRVAILATGNELVAEGAPLRPGAVRDSSTPTLSTLVESAGGVPAPLPIAPDDRALLAERVREGLSHDVLVTTGGVSVGDYDFVKEVLAEQGVKIRFWKVAMKPGKPFVYGIRGETRAFGLPGNPGSSLATFERFVRPALRKMVGDPAWAPAEAEAVLDARCGNAGDRTWFLRAALSWRDGSLHARPLAGQGSGTLRSAGEANGFIVLPPGAINREAGARVTVQILPAVYGEVWNSPPVPKGGAR